MLHDQLGVSSKVWRALSRQLGRRGTLSSVAAIGGMLTLPRFAAQGFRLEFLSHLAVAYSRGSWPLTRWRLRRWLNGPLAEWIARMEDPPEDVFVSNVQAAGRNHRLFEGNWECADSHVQYLVNSLALHPSSRRWHVLRSVTDLLRLSDAIAERSGLKRWELPDEQSRQHHLPRLPSLPSLSRRVTFSETDLSDLGVDTELLEPFVLPEPEWDHVANDPFSHSRLERRPLIRSQGLLVCALPTAISVAIRRYVLEEASALGRMPDLETQLRTSQESELFEELLPRLQLVEGNTSSVRRVSAGGQEASIVSCPIDLTAVAQVALLHDDVSRIATDGLDSFQQLSPAMERVLSQGMKRLTRRHQFVLGIAVFGGLGRGQAIALRSLPDRCGFIGISLADLRTFVSIEGASFLRLTKLNSEEDWLSLQGLQILNMSGVLNLYAFWESQGHTLILDDMHLPGTDLLALPSDSLFDLRSRERMKVDLHSAVVPGLGGAVTVERLHANSFFPSRQNRPIYVAPPLLQRGVLAGVVVGADLAIWVWADRKGLPSEVASYLYWIWQNVLDWLERGHELLAKAGCHWESSIIVRLRLTRPDEWVDSLANSKFPPPETPETALSDDGAVELLLPPGFLTLLNRPKNDGERALLVAVYSALMERYCGKDADWSHTAATQITDKVLKGDDSRNMHVFQARRPADYFEAPKPPAPRLVQAEDAARTRVGLAWRCIEPNEEGATVVGADPARKLLHEAVDALWSILKEELEELNRESLILLLVENVEGIFRDREEWRRTARAVLAMSDDQEEALGVASQREARRAITAISSRVLIEMAASTCPLNGGAKASWRSVDRLAAHVAEIIRLASYSDAIRGGLSPATVSVTPSGRIVVDDGYAKAVSLPYFQRIFDRGFSEAATAYDHLFAEADDTSTKVELEPEFRSAFEAEFGVDIDSVLSAIGALHDLAHTRTSLVVRTTQRELWGLLEKECGLRTTLAKKVLSMLTLPVRHRWDLAPKGYANPDWYPWRFRRRLSVSLRPLIALGPRGKDSVVFGVNQLGASISYYFEGLRTAFFPTEHFSSSEMLQYVGGKANEQGHLFASKVADRLSAQGWRTALEVEISSLGGGAELGDVDVFAWKPEGDQLLVIECKSLIARRNTYELVEELLQFRGEARDRLGRHLARVNWVSDNLPYTLVHLGAPRTVGKIVPLMVTNRDVPMRYLDDLPLPHNRFVSFDDINETFAP